MQNRRKKYEFIETAVDEEKAREVLHNQIQKDQTTEDFQTTLTKERHKANSNERLSLSKVDDEVKSDALAETVEDEPGITYDFDYHDTINAETYEKYFEKVCQLLKPGSVIIIDNASYHSRIQTIFLFRNGRKHSIRTG